MAAKLEVDGLDRDQRCLTRRRLCSSTVRDNSSSRPEANADRENWSRAVAVT
jgi:hypothetical protein